MGAIGLLWAGLATYAFGLTAHPGVLLALLVTLARPQLLTQGTHHTHRLSVLLRPVPQRIVGFPDDPDVQVLPPCSGPRRGGFDALAAGR